MDVSFLLHMPDSSQKHLLSDFRHCQDGVDIVGFAYGKTFDQRIICRANVDAVEDLAELLALVWGHASRCRPKGGDGQIEEVVDKVG